MVKPASPRLPAELEAWSETDSEVEIDRALVRSYEFTDIERISVDTSRLEGVSMVAAAPEKFEWSDVLCLKLEAAALKTYKAGMLRVEMSDCRLTGAEFAEAQFEDCAFKNVKFDEAGFRFASFKRVVFEDCVFAQADFSNAKFSQVVFRGCELAGTNFTWASCSDVDVTSENLAECKGVTGLKGATISEIQLIQLAPLLAAELGFHVKAN